MTAGDEVVSPGTRLAQKWQSTPNPSKMMETKIENQNGFYIIITV